MVRQPTDFEKEFIVQIDRHQRIIHKICFVYAKNRSDKEDLYQEIVLQLWKSYPSFKGNSRFSTWMYRVALNTAITFIKKAPLIFENAEHIPDAFINENALDFTEEVQVLYKAIAHLNRIEKAIVLMWLDEKSYQEMADMMGTTVSNISVKLVRIKKKLSVLLERLQ